MFECLNCGEKALLWDCDYSYDDYELEGDGIVREFHCTKCRAEITLYIPLDDPEEEDVTSDGEA